MKLGVENSANKHCLTLIYNLFTLILGVTERKDECGKKQKRINYRLKDIPPLDYVGLIFMPMDDGYSLEDIRVRPDIIRFFITECKLNLLLSNER